MLLDDSNSDTDNNTDIDDSDDDEDVLYEIGDIAMSSDESDSDVSEDGADDSGRMFQELSYDVQI